MTTTTRKTIIFTTTTTGGQQKQNQPQQPNVEEKTEDVIYIREGRREREREGVPTTYMIHHKINNGSKCKNKYKRIARHKMYEYFFSRSHVCYLQQL